MRCNDPQLLASLIVAMAVIAAITVAAALAAPALLRRTHRTAAAELRKKTTIAQALLFSIAAVFIGCVAILGVAYLAGGLRLCRSLTNETHARYFAKNERVFHDIVASIPS